MTIYSRPDEKVFASGAKPGELVVFPDVLRGWGLAFEQTEGKPPMEWMNGAFLRLDEAVRYFMQRGIPEWSATEDYPVGAYLQHGGTTYRALLANTNVEPGTAALTWTPWGISRSELAALAFSGKFGDLSEVPISSTTVQGLIEIATATEARALTDALRAITPATLKAVLDEFTTGIPGATFAEVDALTEDDGPIIVTDMAGDLYVWASTAHFTGYRNPRSGLWYGGASDTPEAWELLAMGGTWDASDPKHKRVIARYLEWGRVMSAEDWAPGWNFIVDLGSGLYKAPDLRDVFQRMSGTDADTANDATVGAGKGDTMQGHWHELVYKSVSSGNSASVTSANGLIAMGDRSGALKLSQKAGDAGTDGLHGTPKVGAETAPVHARAAPVVLI